MKIINYFKKMPFWKFLAYVLTPFAMLGEGAILKFNGPDWLHGVVIGAFIFNAWIKFNIKDENNNGTPDIFESKK